MFGYKKNKRSKNVAINKPKGDGNFTVQNSTIKVNKGMDEILELARDGDNFGALEKIGIFQRSISAMHPLYPDYRYSVNINDKGVSIGTIANNEAAIKKYPPHGNIKLLIPDEYKWAGTINNLLKYSYEKQIPLNLKAENIKLWLGNYLMEQFEKSEVILTAKEFPAPIPMQFEFENTSFRLSYLEMGLVRIEDDCLIVSNEKQIDTKLILTLLINKSNICNSELKIKVSEKYKNNVDANLKKDKFHFNFLQNGIKKLIVLKDDSEAMAFSNGNNQDFEYLEEMKFLERLNALEKYYDVIFKLPKKVTEDDEETLLILEKSMNNEPIQGTYDYVSMSLTVKSSLDQLNHLAQDGITISCVNKNENIGIFGQNIIFKERIQSFYNTILDNKEKTLKKFELADDGDVITVKYIPLYSLNNKADICYHFK